MHFFYYSFYSSDNIDTILLHEIKIAEDLVTKTQKFIFKPKLPLSKTDTYFKIIMMFRVSTFKSFCQNSEVSRIAIMKNCFFKMLL